MSRAEGPVAASVQVVPLSEVNGWLEGIQTEIIAGKVMRVRNEGDRAHNDACSRAVRIIDGYIKGKGLYQLADKKRLENSK